jgi:mannose-6-phosphate isomerase
MIEKPWGRTRILSSFGDTGGRKVGEVWFEGASDLPLLAKYIFTSEKLSIQSHPNESTARAAGLKNGKDECWYILDAEPGATLGLGLRSVTSKGELRRSALDGSIEELVEWKTVAPGDFFYVPAGTIHAIGAGVTLLEFQQNIDVTYRLYDYGRPRELHLDEGIKVARAEPYDDARAAHVPPDGPRVLVDGPFFHFLQAVDGQLPSRDLQDRLRWILPLDGTVRSRDDQAGFGECLLVEAGVEVDLGQGRVLIGALADA